MSKLDLGIFSEAITGKKSTFKIDYWIIVKA